MTRIRMIGWIAAAALLAAVPVSAETFHSQAGVVFEGTLRKVVPQAAVCNVLEQNHTPDEYERLKSNQGRPLDLWQVDFAVRNESGRAIEHLRASGWVRTEHPPCTNWSGEGPGGGPVLPQPGLMVPTVWSDYFQMLQRADGMRPGEQERRSIYVVVFGECQPRFGEWDIDYRFASGSGGTTQSGPGPQAAAPAFVLPPEIQADRYLLQAEEQIQKQDYEAAKAAMELILQLQQQHELTIPKGFYFRYAQVLQRVGLYNEAVEYVTRYLTAAGREGEHYREALQLLNAAEAETFSAERTCGGKLEGAECWKELESHPGCYVWDDHYYADQTVTWTSGCSGGLASGTGNLKWVRGDGENEHTGLLRGGKHQGNWVLRFADGDVHEGPYVDGKRHGDWVIHDGDGNVGEGPFVDGNANGDWVVRRADGDVYEGLMVDGEKNGRWVERHADGNVFEGPYVDGKRQGRWVERDPDGRVWEGPFVDDKMHGRWVSRNKDGTTQVNTWVHGELQRQ